MRYFILFVFVIHIDISFLGGNYQHINIMEIPLPEEILDIDLWVNDLEIDLWPNESDSDEFYGDEFYDDALIVLFMPTFGGGTGEFICMECGHFNHESYHCEYCYDKLATQEIPGTGKNFEINGCKYTNRFTGEMFFCEICKTNRHILLCCSDNGFITIPISEISCIYCNIISSPFRDADRICANCIAYGTFINGTFIGCGQDDEYYENDVSLKNKVLKNVRFHESMLHEKSIIAFLIIWHFRDQECPYVFSLPREIINIIISFIQELY